VARPGLLDFKLLGLSWLAHLIMLMAMARI